MTTLYLIGLATFLSYTTFTIIKNGISSSFSDTYYQLGKLGWLFQLNMIILTFSLAPVILSLTEGYWWQFISFFTIAPIAFVGVAPLFKIEKSVERKVHFVAAAISAVASMIFISLSAIQINPLIWYALILSILTMSLFYVVDKFRNLVWWTEYICFVSLLSTLGILLFV